MIDLFKFEKRGRIVSVAGFLLFLFWGCAWAQNETPIDPNPGTGAYAASLRDPGKIDSPIPGFVGPDGEGKARLQSGVDIDGNPIYSNVNNYVNPIFKEWASEVVDYSPTPGVAGQWKDASKALGPVTGDNFDIVTLGELYRTTDYTLPNGTVLPAPKAGQKPPYVNSSDPAYVSYSGDPTNQNDGFGFIGYDAPGSITLKFNTAIVNGTGADFAVFENAFTSNYTTDNGTKAGETFAELAYVEVSTDGIHFARFPSVSLTPEAVNKYGTIDASNVYNLAGKSANAYGESWGTPFDLSSLLTDTAAQTLIAQGYLNLNEINYVRIVDIPGDGTFLDSGGDPIYDAWYTFGSGGFDLEAIGAINVVPIQAWRDTWFGTMNNSDMAANSAAPAGDCIANLIKYATSTSSANPATPGIMPGSLTVSDAIMSYTYNTNPDARDVIYTVQYSNDLVNWTNSTAVTTSGSVGSDGTVPVTVSLNTSLGNFVRLMVTSTSDSESATTTPMGTTTLTLPSGDSVIGINLIKAPVFTGSLTGVGSYTLTVSGVDLTTYLATGKHYAVRLISGANSGRNTLVTAWNATGLTLKDSLSNIANVGDTIQVQQLPTISDIFGATPTVLAGGSSTNADLVKVRDPYTGELLTIYPYKFGATTGWRALNHGSSSYADQPVYFTDGLRIQKKSAGTTSLQTTGFVQQGPVTLTAVSGLAYYASIYAVGTILDNSALYNGGNSTYSLVGGSSSVADLIKLDSNSDGVFETYYYYIFGSSKMWRLLGNTANKGSLTLPSGFTIDNQHGAVNLSRTPPY